MLGHGTDDALYCKDCDKSFAVDSMQGGFVGFNKGRPHLESNLHGSDANPEHTCPECGSVLVPYMHDAWTCTDCGENWTENELMDADPLCGNCGSIRMSANNVCLDCGEPWRAGNRYDVDVYEGAIHEIYAGSLKPGDTIEHIGEPVEVIGEPERWANGYFWVPVRRPSGEEKKVAIDGRASVKKLNEGYSFDRHLDAILIKEARGAEIKQPETANRKMIKKYRERPANRTYFK